MIIADDLPTQLRVSYRPHQLEQQSAHDTGHGVRLVLFAEPGSIECPPTLYASITMAMAAAPRIVSRNGTIGSQALFLADDQADSKARGKTYMATRQLDPTHTELGAPSSALLFWQMSAEAQIADCFTHLFLDQQAQTGRKAHQPECLSPAQ
jgi:hypothetical protein